MATPQITCHIDFQPRGSIKTLKFSSHHLRHATNLISKPKPKSLETNFGVFASGLRKGARFSHLAAIQKPISDEDKIVQLSHCLGKKYEVFNTTMLSKPPFPTFNQFITALQGYDMWIQGNQIKEKEETNHNMAFIAQRNRGRGRAYSRGRTHGHSFSSRGRGFVPANFSPNSSGRGHSPYLSQFSPRDNHSGTQSKGSTFPANYNPQSQKPSIQCQICDRFGHPASKCWYRYDYSHESTDNLSQALVSTTLSDTQDQDPTWYTDTVATSHMTYDKGNLQHSSIYNGYNHVIVGNGTRLKISHVGDTVLYSPHGKLNLHDVLVVPDIKKNLISVTKLTKDNSCFFEFRSFDFKIKDQTTGKILAIRHRKDGLYALEEGGEIEALVAIKSGKAPVDLWHQRLGHPNSRLLHVLDSKKFIDLSSWLKNKNICSSCQTAKSCRLPFSLNKKIDSAPLTKIHCDLWGPVPISSVQQFKFYAIFIDDHSRFTWFYPLKNKSSFFKTFVSFQRMVENQFNSKIKIFQCDGGGEFELKEFITHLDNHGIVKNISCPGTPEQNGIAERKHRHLVETGLTMLFHAQLPKHLWVDAFTAAVYLINRLPSSILQMQTPFYKLYGIHPTYSSLKVFGC